MSQGYEVGVSGMALYTPRPRVQLRDWCDWTGTPWAKIQQVVGRSFRTLAAHEDAYTMAANAALRLIVSYDIDPRRVGLLILGTESSKDNSAGAVIVRGMLDEALEALGRPRLSRECEVPEIKHACLGGIYGLKSALRYVATDGADRQAIVISSDVAEYARGSSGEPTQGAGAVAMWVTAEPQLFSVDLRRAGSASAYRGPDFRKPSARHFMAGYGEPRTASGRPHDFPVFSGHYSTTAYIDEVHRAFDAALRRDGRGALGYLQGQRALFFHRPYAMMPVQGAAFLMTRALLEARRDEVIGARLVALGEGAGVDLEAAAAELAAAPDLFGALREAGAPQDPYPQANALAKALRKDAWFEALMGDRLRLGAERAMALGNLYTAALPAWLAAGFEEALGGDEELADAPLLAIGYGSGDAAEVLPLRVAAGWRAAAARIKLDEALEGAVDLTQAQYEAAHDGREAVTLAPRGEFFIERVGEVYEAGFQDLGIDYYGFAAT